MKCSHCGHENAADFLFCEECGEQIQQACPNCEHANALDYAFCAECGTALDKKKAAPKKKKKVALVPEPVAASKPTAVPAPQVVGVDKERRRRPAWQWLLLGLIGGPLCLLSLLWFNIMPLPAQAAQSVRGLPAVISAPLANLVENIEQRQEAADRQPVVVAPIAPAQDDGDDGGQEDDGGAAPVAAPPAAGNEAAEAGEDDACADIHQYSNIKTGLWYGSNGDLYVTLENDAGWPGNAGDWVATVTEPGYRLGQNCDLAGETKLVCHLVYEDWIDTYLNDPDDLDYYITEPRFDQYPPDCSYVEVLGEEMPRPEIQGVEDPQAGDDGDEDEGGGRSCSAGYYQIDGQPAGTCCPNGTTYNASANTCQ